MTSRRAIALGFLGVLVTCTIAAARPGGGHTSSGGGRSFSSHSSSSGGGGWGHSSSGGGHYGGGGSLPPGVVVALLAAVIIFSAVAAITKNTNNTGWSSGNLSYMPVAPEPPPPARPLDLSKLTARDPAFSRSAFEDFAFELYAAAQRGRSDPPRLAALSAYLSQQAIDHLARRGPAPSQIVIGSLRIAIVRTGTGDPPPDRLDVRIEATLITDRPRYAVELWTFGRERGVQSKPPTHNRTWPCPNCGAPWVANATRTCDHCNEPMGGGRFDWMVMWIKLESATTALASLTGTVPEYGNDLPTIRAVDVDPQMASLTADDPAITPAAIAARTQLIYARLNQAWNDHDLKKVRGLVTASLRDYLAYWLDEYARQGLTNRLDNAAIERVELSRVTRDLHYDAVVLRVFAGGNDYTLNAKGGVVGGSKSANRRYTEYWTLLRSSARRGPVNTEPTCPNCGAPLEDVSDQGDCTHCNATIETGSFDWVLSKIEQDDNYVG